VGIDSISDYELIPSIHCLNHGPMLGATVAGTDNALISRYIRGPVLFHNKMKPFTTDNHCLLDKESIIKILLRLRW